MVIRRIAADNRGYVFRLLSLGKWAEALAGSAAQADIQQVISAHSRDSRGHTSISDEVDEGIFRQQVLHRLAVALAGEGRCDVALSAVNAIWRAEDRIPAISETALAMARSGHFDQALTTLYAPGIEEYLQTLCQWSPTFASQMPGVAVEVLREACSVLNWVRPDFRRLVDLLGNG